MKTVSIYVPCYNGEKHIARCLEALLTLDYPTDDIMLIDDGSTDSTALIAQRYPRVRLIRQATNKGLAAARNLGLRSARHDLVASVDADVIASKNWLTELVRVAEKLPNASGYGGRLIESVTCGWGNRWRGEHLRQDWGDKRIVRPPFLFGSNMLMRREPILAIGGYDERMRTNGEDVNLAYRLSQAGHYLVFDPAPVCYHLRKDSVGSVMRMHWRWMRHPWIILFPPQNMPELLAFLCKRIWRPCRDAADRDWQNKNWRLLVLSLWLYADHTWREVQAYLGRDKTPAS